MQSEIAVQRVLKIIHRVHKKNVSQTSFGCNFKVVNKFPSNMAISFLS